MENKVIETYENNESVLSLRDIFDSSDKNSEVYTKSKQRIADLGEVFTPDFIVDAMCDLGDIKKLSYSLDATFLEPSCGTGNFIVELLARKMAVAVYLATNGQSKLDLAILRAVASLYGIDIMSDNIREAKERMWSVITSAYKHGAEAIGLETSDIPDILRKNVNYILDRNIIFGNTLKREMLQLDRSTKRKYLQSGECCLDDVPDSDKVELEFTEWTFDTENETVKQVLYGGEFFETLSATCDKKPIERLYSTKERDFFREGQQYFD